MYILSIHKAASTIIPILGQLKKFNILQEKSCSALTSLKSTGNRWTLESKKMGKRCKTRATLTAAQERQLDETN